MTEFIFEIGGNHQGDKKKLLSLTQKAIKAGAKILKYQIYTGESLVSKKYDPERVDHFNSFTLDKNIYKEVFNLCSEANVEFMASIWSESLFHEFDEYVKRYKIGSGDLTNYPLIKLMAEKGKPIILSTGLSDLEEIDSTVEYIRSINKNYKKPENLCILQCTSLYPCPLNEVNLNVIEEFKRRYESKVGYSHHTIQYSPIYNAVSMGVDIIEFHFTDSKHDNNFRDHLVSIDILEYKKIAAFYEETLILRGSPKKKLSDLEKSSGNLVSFRRSLFYKKGLKAGHVLTERDLESLRPGIGISPSKILDYVGLTLLKEVNKGEALQEDHF